MQQANETNADACAYNDFALVRIDPADVGRVSASVPGFGGPTGHRRAERDRRHVYCYGNSSLRGGVTQLSPKQGKRRSRRAGNGWSRTVYTVTPGIPGDSGSGFLDAQGKAIGTLSTVAIAPLAGVERRGGPRPRAELRGVEGHRRVAGERRSVQRQHRRRHPRQPG